MHYRGLDLTIFPRISLILFGVFFLLSVVWVYRRGSKKQYNQASHLPFDDEASEHE